MKVPQKIKFLNKFRKIFPIWTLTLQAKVIEHAFDLQMAEAMKKGERQKCDEFSQAQYFESSEYWDQLRSLRSRRLVKRAEKMFVPLADMKWEMGNFGSQYLTKESESTLYHAVREIQRKDWEFRIKAILALAALASTLTSLVLALKK